MKFDLVSFIILTHYSATLMMTGIIWFAQLVFYPLFKMFKEKQRFEYCSKYISKASNLAVPILITELVTGVLILFRLFDEWIWYVNLFFISLSWWATVFYQIPLLLDLKEGENIPSVDSLTRKNMTRTFSWSFRSILLFVYILTH
ncbi:MAG: hypothetical protein AAGG81_08825 [Chlamydiota bacterium]